MKIAIIDNGSRHLGALVRLCDRYGDPSVHSAEKLGEIEKYDLIVLSGSHAHRVKGGGHFYRQERELVERHDGPIIGICAGMELIASVYGARLGRMGAEAEGKRTIYLSDSRLRFALGGSPTARVAERHGWAVSDVAAPLRVLAYSQTGVEVVVHKDRLLYGLQFHPELSPNGGRRIFEWVLGNLMVETSAYRSEIARKFVPTV